jgi:hypothetical protein
MWTTEQLDKALAWLMSQDDDTLDARYLALAEVWAEMNRTTENLPDPTLEDYLEDIRRRIVTIEEGGF